MKAYRKAIVAGLVAALTAAQTAVPMSPAAHGWVTVGLAFFGTVGVFAVRNTPQVRTSRSVRPSR